MWLGPFLRKVGYDPVKDFAPISLAVRAPNILVVHPSLPVKSVKDLIALARSKPGALNYSAGSPGGATHLAAEMFKSMAGVNIQYVSYKSSTLETSDLLGGYVQLTFGAAGSVSPHIKSGKLKGLAVTSADPSSLFPGLPTIAAAAGLPGYEVGIIYGLWAPAKTPTAIVNRLNQETVRVLNMPATKQRFLVTGVETVANSPDEFAAVITSDMAKLGKVINDIGIRAE
jgi:tripartite-type tricarboxylate transporter receptor subunit TctC